MVSNLLDSFLQFVEKHPVLFVEIAAISGPILFVIGLFFRQIANFTTRFAKWLWMKMRGRGKDHDFEISYLDWLIGEHRYLSMLPAQQVTRRWNDRQRLGDLEKIYTKLSISTQSGDEHWAETYGNGESSWRQRSWIGLRLIKGLTRFLLPSALLSSIPFLTEQRYQPGDLGLVIDRHKRLVIRGDPGSGKTTFLRYLAVTCARTLRNNKRDGDSSRHVKKRLLWTTRPFPIFVRLRRHGNVASWDDAKELTATILEEMPSELRRRCPPDFFERRLRKGRCLVLLDAFDELGSPEARAAMARKIAGFLAIYQRNDNRTVVTTRIVGYEAQLDRYDFAVRTVQNLKAGEIRALVKQRYTAIALAEMASRSDRESKDIEWRMRERAERLIEKIESTPRLDQLATNPMLLSLIVLVHSVKIELPEERLLLYRDCVEILAENWQQFKREEIGIKREEREELTLSQKLILLRELAFAMQQQRKDEGSLALMPKDVARDIIAQKLPDFLGGASPQDEHAKEEISHKAEAWVKSIQAESGILVEQGLDEAGEPLIGFSHLTFQEYLTAVAIREENTYQQLLWQNMLQPAWQEVVLLYAASTNDATPLMDALLISAVQPHGALLAGRCMAERLKKVEAATQQSTLEKLKGGFSTADDEEASDFGSVMGLLRESEITAFMRQQLSNISLKKQLAAVKALGQTREDSLELEQVRADLVKMLETTGENTIIVTVREVLAQVGDPRFSGPEPMLVRVPAQPRNVPALMRKWKDIKTSPEWVTAKQLGQRFYMLTRVVDYWLFTKWCSISRRQVHGYEFEIGKYTITNIEYRRFIEDTKHRTPKSWKEGTFPREEATHPVVGVTKQDAQAYCKWLSGKTSKKYRLPTEWEWEWTAAGPEGWKYPWGYQFDKDKCNTKESGIEGTTPVGSYLAGNSSCGASDMCGNVREITSGIMLGLGLLSGLLSGLVLGSGLLSGLVLVLGLGSVSVSVSVSVSALGSVSVSGLALALVLVLVSGLGLVLVLGLVSGSVSVSALVEMTKLIVLKGGAWNTPSDKAICFYREDMTATTFAGFRCVKEV